MSRKSILWLLMTLLLVISMLLSACGGEEATEVPEVEEPETTAEETTAEEPAGEDMVEVFSWWTGGGEAAGLEAMIEVFKGDYPNIEFVNAAVAGGAGTNARAVLATRLQAGDAPDSWQGHAGW
jgi:glucose/mannose transport system substrate-binding protein